MDLQVGVKVLLTDGSGKYLLLKRSAEKYPEVGPKWDIPGGRINPGKPLLENLRREVLEETGLKLESEPKLIAAQDILRIEGRHVVRLTFLGKAEGIPKLNEDSTEFIWASRGELEQLENLDIYVKELLDRKLL